MLPRPVVLAHRLAGCLTTARKSGMVRGLRPDGKAQVTVEYDEDGRKEKLPSMSVIVPFVAFPFSTTLAPITGPIASLTTPFTLIG